MSKVDEIVVNTPVGSIKWFKLVNPDQKYKKYSVDLILEDGEALQKLLAQIEDMGAAQLELSTSEAKPAMKKKIRMSMNEAISTEFDEEGNETGRFIMKLRQNSQYEDKKTKEIKMMHPPRLFDAKAKEITGEARTQLFVGNGSEARAQIKLSAYCLPAGDVGVSCKPLAIQLIKVVQGSAPEVDFDAVEGGFEVSFDAVKEDSGDGDF